MMLEASRGVQLASITRTYFSSWLAMQSEFLKREGADIEKDPKGVISQTLDGMSKVVRVRNRYEIE